MWKDFKSSLTRIAPTHKEKGKKGESHLKRRGDQNKRSERWARGLPFAIQEFVEIRSPDQEGRE